MHTIQNTKKITHIIYDYNIKYTHTNMHIKYKFYVNELHLSTESLKLKMIDNY